MAFHPNHLSQDMALQHFSDSDNNSALRTVISDHLAVAGQSSPSSRSPVKDHWHNTKVLRPPVQYGGGATESNSDSPMTSSFQHHHLSAGNNNRWLSRPTLQRNDVVSQVSDDPIIVGAGAMSSHDSPMAGNIVAGQVDNNGGSEVGGGNGGSVTAAVNWQNARYKAEVLSHPLYEQLLSAHVACLRIATPVDQLPRIDAQLAQSQQVVSKYSGFGGHGDLGDDKELDQFMTHYIMLLCSFKEQLQQHVRVHAMDAVMACWEIEQSLQSLTGLKIRTSV